MTGNEFRDMAILWMIVFWTGVVVGAVLSAKFRCTLKGVIWTTGATFVVVVLGMGVYGVIWPYGNRDLPVLMVAISGACFYGALICITCSPPAIAGSALGLSLGQQFHSSTKTDQNEERKRFQEEETEKRETDDR